MVVRIFAGWIDEQRRAFAVTWKAIPFLVTVAVRTGQEVIEPVEGPERSLGERLEMVDVSAQVIATVHTGFDPHNHGFEARSDLIPYAVGGFPPLTRQRGIRLIGGQFLGGDSEPIREVKGQRRAMNGNHDGSVKLAATSFTRVVKELFNCSRRTSYSCSSSAEAVLSSIARSSTTSRCRCLSASSE